MTSFANHLIIATYIGKNERTFKVGSSYLLRVEFRGTGIYPINVVLDYAQHYTSIPYRTIIDFLKEWTEIVTVIDPKLVEKSSKVLYIDDSGDSELPFDQEDDEILKDYRNPKPSLPSLVMDKPSTDLARIHGKIVLSNGAWVCDKCRQVNFDPSAERCKCCGGKRILFDE